MSFEQLPDELLIMIFELLPTSVLYKFIDSTTYGKFAQSIIYRHVCLDLKSTHLSSNAIISRYSDTIYDSPFENKFEDEFQKPTKIPVGPPVFYSACKLICFFQDRPFLRPDTLSCYDFQDLVALESYQPGILNRFKNFQVYGSNSRGFEDIPSFLFSKCFKVFVGASNKPTPKNIQTLSIGHFHPGRKFMPSVRTLILGDPLTNEVLESFPNVENLECRWSDTHAISFDNSNLTTLSTSGPEVDLSRGTTLEKVTFQLHNSAEVGYFDTCSHRIPTGLQWLSLHNFTHCDQLQLLAGEELPLKGLSIKMGTSSQRNYGSIEVPFGLLRLKLDGRGDADCKDLYLPGTIEQLTINNFTRLSFWSIPTSLKRIDLKNCNLENMENLSQFTRLTYLRLSNKSLKSNKLPPSLTDLELDDYHGWDPMASLPKLQHFKHTFMGNERSRERIIRVNPALRSLELVSATISGIDGCEKLVHLVLRDVVCTEPFQGMEFPSLKSLHVDTGGKPIVFKSLPDSLESLFLSSLEISKPMACPESLRLLSVANCNNFEDSIIMNAYLESLVIDNSIFNISTMLKAPSKSLNTVLLSHCDLGYLKIDFTLTGLKEFQMTRCCFRPVKVKFPACLETLSNHYENLGTYEPHRMKWVDLSACEQLLTFKYNPREYNTKPNRRTLQKLKAAVAGMQAKFQRTITPL